MHTREIKVEKITAVEVIVLGVPVGNLWHLLVHEHGGGCHYAGNWAYHGNALTQVRAGQVKVTRAEAERAVEELHRK